jgi:hypothetical protein
MLHIWISCTIFRLHAHSQRTPPQKNPVFLNNNIATEIRILFFNFSVTFILKCTYTRTHDNINLFLRET